MRVMGHNVFAIVVAAIAIWAIGFLLYVVLFQAQWMAWMGVTEEQMQHDNGRMPFMVVMPFLQAIGLSLAVKWRNAPGWMGGLMTAFCMAMFLSIAGAHVWLGLFVRGDRAVRPRQHAFPAHARGRGRDSRGVEIK